VAKRRRQLKKEAADRKPYIPEPTASPLGVQFSAHYDKPYLKDFVKKRKENIQREMTFKVQNKAFYLPINPKSASFKTQRNSKIANCKVQVQEKLSSFEMAWSNYGLSPSAADGKRIEYKSFTRVFSGHCRNPSLNDRKGGESYMQSNSDQVTVATGRNPTPSTNNIHIMKTPVIRNSSCQPKIGSTRATTK